MAVNEKDVLATALKATEAEFKARFRALIRANPEFIHGAQPAVTQPSQAEIDAAVTKVHTAPTRAELGTAYAELEKLVGVQQASDLIARRHHAES